MRLLFKFLSLPTYKKILLIKAAFLLTIMRLVIFLVPLKSIKRLVEELLIIKSMVKQDTGQSEIKWAVDTASNYITFTKTCLVKSLAMHILLIRNGFESTLNIGVTKDKSEKLGAHAWVESDGEVLIAKEHAYTRLLSIEGQTK